MVLEVSGNIIKNVKSVVVPNTNGMKGLEAAAAAGIVAGKSEKKLEVISEVTEEEKEGMAPFAFHACQATALGKEYIDAACHRTLVWRLC